MFLSLSEWEWASDRTVGHDEGLGVVKAVRGGVQRTYLRGDDIKMFCF